MPYGTLYFFNAGEVKVLIKADYYKGKIIIVISGYYPDLETKLSMWKKAYESGDIWIVNSFYVLEVSKLLGPYKDVLEVGEALKKHKRDFVEDCIETFEGKKSNIIIDVFPNYSKISGTPVPDDILDRNMRYFFKPAVRMKKFKDGRWDGYFHLYEDMKFPTGLLSVAKSTLNGKGLSYKVIYRYERRPRRKFDWVVDDNITPDPDQIEAINAAYNAGRSVVKAPTGFGKTAILAKRLTAKFGVRTLFVANKKALLDDAKHEFAEGITGLTLESIGEIKDGIFGLTKIKSDMTGNDIPPLDFEVMVATIQSLDAKLKDPRTSKKLKAWLKGVEFVMVDEVQAVGTAIWDEVLDNVFAPYRVFLSATPKRTDGATMKIFARAGDLSFTTTAEEQIEKGRLSEAEIICKIYDHKLFNKDDSSVIYTDAYQAWIVENQDRNEIVVQNALEMVNEGRHVLVLFQYIEHGEILRDLIIKRGLPEDQVRFIYGSTKNEVRKRAIAEFRKGEFKVLIGSTIFDAGVNIPIISGMVLAGAGNSEITLVQRIGRSVRTADYEDILGELPDFMKEADGQKVAKIIDIYDANIIFFEKQARNRYNIAKSEFGASRVSIVGERLKDVESIAEVKISDEEIEKAMQDLNNAFEGLASGTTTYTDEDFEELTKAFNGL